MRTSMLKRFAILIGAVGLASAAMAQQSQQPAPAAPAAAAPQAKSGLPPVIVALFDKEALFRESAAGKDFRKQLEELRNKFQGDLAHQQEELKKKDQDLRN